MSGAKASRPSPDGAMTALAARLGVLRQERGLTLDALAEATGLDKGYLSRLERGLKGPSIATLLRLSQALDVPVAELLGERLAEHAVRVTRAASRLVGAPVSDTTHGFEGLSRAGAALEAFVVHPAAEFRTDGPIAEHAGEELFYVLTGTIELRFVDRGFVLEAGDCAQFPGSLPHRLRRIGPEPASALVAVAKTRTSGRRGTAT
ncbi:MAG TPA: XRE family transcriptional regulator [Stellaceae bacterium]|nr:XRE family transcriptional regulator [Stellaceae bacterium]